MRQLETFDYDEIMATQTRNGLSTRGRESWLQWLFDHPHKALLGGIGVGWVLTDSGRIVGTNTNVPMLYFYNSRKISVANASTWAVDLEYRNSSLKLGMAWMRQTEPDLLIDTSAIEPVAKLLLALRFQQMPLESYTQSMLWVLDYKKFMNAVLRKKRVAGAKLISALGGPVLRIFDSLRGRAAKPVFDSPIQVREVPTFGAEFDEIWDTLILQKDRLLLCRDRQSLLWRHADALKDGRACILIAYKSGRPSGFVVLWQIRREQYELDAFEVADLQAFEDDNLCIKALLHEAIAVGRKRGLSMMELTGFNQAKRDAALQMRPYQRVASNFPYYFKARDKVFERDLMDPEKWDPSLSDGF